MDTLAPMMTLKEYIEANEGIDEFSSSIGVIPTTLYRYINGTRKPRPEIAQKIVAATDGKVSFESLYSAA